MAKTKYEENSNKGLQNTTKKTKDPQHLSFASVCVLIIEHPIFFKNLRNLLRKLVWNLDRTRKQNKTIPDLHNSA